MVPSIACILINQSTESTELHYLIIISLDAGCWTIGPYHRFQIYQIYFTIITVDF